MNVYVITRNYYLYQGISHSLRAVSKFNFIHILPYESSCLDVIVAATPEDILLLITDGGFKYDFQFLASASKCRASVVYSGCFENFKFHEMFGFTLIGGTFYLNDLLQVLNVRNNISRCIRYPEITEKEKDILFHTWKGISVNDIAGLMSIEPKTVYHYQHNLLQKIGVRKPRDLLLLPHNFIESMLQNHAD